MNIKFGDLSRLYKSISNEIDEAIKRVNIKGWYLLGEELESFEREFASYCNSKYAAGVANCTDALAITLLSLDIGKDDEIITTTHTAIPTGMAIMQVGAKPVFVDIIKDEQNLDPAKLEERINKRTKAIIPVHLYGLPARLNEINEIASRYKISVIEDAAQAHGAVYNKILIGGSGNLTCFSFYPSKNLGAIGDGGIITTNDEYLYKKIKKLRNYGQSTRYISDLIGMNSRLDEINAAVLRVKLKYLDEFNIRREEISNIYDESLSDKLEKPIRKTQNSKSSNHLYVIRTNKRDELQEYLGKKGIQTIIHYPLPLHQQPCFSNYNNKLPIAEENANRILSLPLYPELRDEEVYSVCDNINGFFGE